MGVAERTLSFLDALAAKPSRPGCELVLKVLDALLKLNLGMLIHDECMLPKF
jgi:hypothetical protein